MKRTALASVWPPTAAAAAQAGQERMSPVQAIRRKCLECCGYQVMEVKLCQAVQCPLWPFRSGRHPYTKGSLQEGDLVQGASSGGPVPASRASSRIGFQKPNFGQGEETGGRSADEVY